MADERVPNREAAPEVRQRWRLLLERGAPTVEPSAPVARPDEDDWEAALARSSLPLATDGRGRPKVSRGASLPLGTETGREPIEIALAERWTVDRVRVAIEAALPPHDRLIGLHDVWLGAAPLQAIVVAARYRIELGCDARVAATIVGAVPALLEAPRLDRVRRRGSGDRPYDLRPLVASLSAATFPDGVELRAVLRHDPEFGSGRPDELVAALADLAGLSAESRHPASLARQARATGLPPEPGPGGAESPRPATPDVRLLRVVREELLLDER